ncbi:MAG: hypothetical protein HY568_01005 [Candidatus Latescibacteria bacterium]|nr:hypothetical protein [Candidatus Latescibacterota bacterium]
MTPAKAGPAISRRSPGTQRRRSAFRPTERDLVAGAESLRAEHERLCFMRAFPRTSSERRRAERVLAGFESRIAYVRDHLEDSGIAGTLYRYPYNYRMARWLSETYGRAVSIDWDRYKRGAWDDLAGSLALVACWAEMDGIDDDRSGSWDWVRAARRGRGSDLAWILALIRSGGLPTEVERHVYESAGLPLTWDLSGCRESVTHLALPAGPLFLSREIRRERPPDFKAAVRERVGPLEVVAPSRAERCIEAARAALALREREFHVIVHANPRECYLTECGRGLRIITFGLPEPLRLPLEADYGCLLLRNGVPIGYAYGAVVFDRCDIGINVFPTYRDGESAYAFTKLSALFRQHFGSRVFIVRNYQIGHQNPEGIQAGSFWFYWRLGFRPMNSRIRRLAESEERRLSLRPGSRSDPAMLRRLARSDLVWRLDGASLEGFRDYDVAAVGRAVTRLIERRYGGDRSAAERRSAALVSRALGADRVPERSALLAALIPRLDAWPSRDKSRLARVLRAKFGARERGYVLALRSADRYREFIATF